jgi:hypothetical protein
MDRAVGSEHIVTTDFNPLHVTRLSKQSAVGTVLYESNLRFSRQVCDTLFNGLKFVVTRLIEATPLEFPDLSTHLRLSLLPAV